MFRKLFYTKTSVVLLIFFLVCFFDFAYLPGTLSLKNDRKLFYVLAFLLVLGVGSYKRPANVFSKRLNYLFAFLFVFAIINCISCYFYRHQMPWITFYHWSPIFLIFLYYPFRSLHFSVKSWEMILISIFAIEVVAEIIQNLFPEFHLFTMTSGNEKFDNELRVRIYGNSILYIGNLFCLNKALVLDERKWIYWMMYIVSFVLILLAGFRMIIFANLVSSLIMLYRTKKVGLKSFIVLLSFLLLIVGLANTTVGEKRLKEVIERNEKWNMGNEDYVRIVTLNYYLNDYFKSPTEMFLGSGLVKRSFTKDMDFLETMKYESNYSREVSDASIRHHIFPVDWGLLGFSWEGGMPAALVLLLIVLMLIVFSRVDKKYLYISAWGIMVWLFSLLNSHLYIHHNIIYTTILLVICDKLYQVKKIETSINHENRNTNIATSH